jgi:signal transduction histidine kinase
MRSPRVLALLAGGLLVLVGGAGTVGLVSLARDVERARLRFVERAGLLAETLAEAFEAAARDVGADERAFRVRARLDGTLLEPLPPDRSAAERRRDQDASLVATAAAEVDAHDRAGASDLGDARLAALCERTDRPALAAFAHSWLAARARRAGRLEQARVHLEALAGPFADERDERGLAHGFAARAELLTLDGDPADGLAALHADLLRDAGSNADTATLALAARVRERLAVRDAESARVAADEAAERSRPFALVGEWSRGTSEWFARGAPRGVHLATFERGEPLVLVAEEPGADGEVVAHALELRSVAERARARLEPGELETALVGPGDVLLAGARAPDGVPAGVRRVRAPLDAVEASAHLADFERYASVERRRFQVVAGVFAGALVAAAAAGATIVRGVTRDARRAAEREAFVAAVTHELKTPIASIRLLAELLERGDVEAERVREFGRRTVGEAVRLGRLIDSVLGFARVARGAPGATLAVCDLSDVLGEAVASVEPLARERGFEVRLAPLPAEARVRGERDALVWAVSELVENATKYGRPEGGVDVVVEPAGAHLRVGVLDRGPGVPAEERERVFEPFRRLGDELTRERPGVGLGLALVRGRVEALGGRVGCDPRAGGGTCFWIELERAARTT